MIILSLNMIILRRNMIILLRNINDSSTQLQLGFVSMSDVSLNKLINGWSILDKIPIAVLLIGYSNTGRTTLAELIKKYFYKNPTPGLIYDGGKYNLQNKISSKSIKMQTTVPQVYEANNNSKQDVKILDIPSFCLSPDNKRWTGLEQKITAGFMFEKVQRVGFLLFLDEKNTKTNVGPLKKLLNSFIDLFNGDLSDQIENSIGIIITKSPDIKQDTMTKRLDSMLKTLAKQKGINIQAVQKIFKKILSNNRVFVMKKVTGQAPQEQEIIDLAKRLQTLPNCLIDKNRVKQLVWSPEEEKVIGDYVSSSGMQMQNLIQKIKQVFSQVNLTAESIRQAKSKNKIKRNYGDDFSPNLVLKDLLQANDIKRINILQIVGNYIDFKNAMKELNAQILIDKIQQILISIIKLQIFFNEPEDLIIFQTIFEAFSFIKAMNYKQVSLQRHLQAINSLFNKDVAESILKLLVQAQISNDNKQFYEKAITFISTEQPIPASLNIFYERCQFKLIKYLPPKQAIPKLFQMLKERKDQNMVLQILLELAFALKKADLIKQALFLFKLAKCPLQAIECYKEIINNDQKETKEYIIYLTEIYLFQQAKYACYNMAAKFGTGSRERFGELLRTVISEQKKYFNETIQSNILLEDIEINQYAFSQIEKAVHRVVSSI